MTQTIRKSKGSTARARTRASRDVPNMEDVEMATPAEDEPRDEGDELLDDEISDDSDADEAPEDAGDEDEEVLTPEDTEALNRALARTPQAVAVPTRRAVVLPSFMYGNPVTRYIAESITELSKVTAPSNREAWNMTIVVIIFSAVIALILGLADLGLLRVLSWLINLGH